MKLKPILAAAFAGLGAIPGSAQEAPPLPDVLLELGQDEAERMTVPVSIGGSGPYRFIVDTGAERTVIDSDLARSLGLVPGRRSTVHSMTEVSRVDTVFIPSLEVGGKRVRGIEAPALERRHMGAQGLLGVDSLQSQRVFFDFVRQEMTIMPSRRREERWAADAIVVTARNRFGHLVLVDASVEGHKVWVILDTGSEVTVGNEALRRRLARKGDLGATHPIEMLSVTGGRRIADATRVRTIRIGGLDIKDLPIAFADVHPFRKLDLLDRPALLLGMDALQLFERVSVDFANRRVRLAPPGSSRVEAGTKLAVAKSATRSRAGL